MSSPQRDCDSAALQAFLRRIWREDVAPLLRDRRAQRAAAARRGVQVGGAAGLALDGLLRLRGRPFTRMLTVLGGRFGALLPDTWDWGWLRARASAREQSVIEERVSLRARELADDEALRLLGVAQTASPAELKAAWRAHARRWHPDMAPDPAQRAEYRIRFITYQAAYERLRAACEAGRWPPA